MQADSRAGWSVTLRAKPCPCVPWCRQTPCTFCQHETHAITQFGVTLDRSSAVFDGNVGACISKTRYNFASYQIYVLQMNAHF